METDSEMENRMTAGVWEILGDGGIEQNGNWTYGHGEQSADSWGEGI